MLLQHYKPSHEWRGTTRGYGISGEHYPGVTSILQATKPEADQKVLTAWKVRTPKATQQANLDRGTAVHSEIEHFLKTGTYRDGISQAHLSYLEGMKGFLEKITKTYLIEGSVWHPDGYAGTVDAGIEIHNGNFLADWKTSNSFKSNCHVEDYKIQVAAYCGAWNNVYPDFKLNQAVIVVGIKDNVCQVFWIDPKKMMELWGKWKKRLARYKTLSAA